MGPVLPQKLHLQEALTAQGSEVGSWRNRGRVTGITEQKHPVQLKALEPEPPEHLCDWVHPEPPLSPPLSDGAKSRPPTPAGCVLCPQQSAGTTFPRIPVLHGSESHLAPRDRCVEGRSEVLAPSPWGRGRCRVPGAAAAMHVLLTHGLHLGGGRRPAQHPLPLLGPSSVSVP